MRAVIGSSICAVLVASLGRAEDPPNAATSEPRDERPWGDATCGVRCVIKVESGQGVPLGESFMIDMRVRNFGQEAVEILHGNPTYFFKLEIIGPDGRTPPVVRRGRAALRDIYDAGSVRWSKLGPGKGFGGPIDYSGEYDMTQPGEYRVTLSGGVRTGEGRAGGSFVSNTVRLVIPGPDRPPVEAPRPAAPRRRASAEPAAAADRPTR